MLIKKYRKLVLILFVISISRSFIYAQNNDFTPILGANVLKEIADNEIVYDSKKQGKQGIYSYAEILRLDNKFVLMFEEGKNKDSAHRIFFTILGISCELINSMEQDADGIRFEGYVACKQLNIEKRTFIMELYSNDYLSIRIGRNLKLCNNIKNFNLEKLVKFSEQRRKDINPSIESITFRPRNANIVDLEGSHNFTSYDCPNMNVIDKKESIDISWGGDKVILHRNSYNEDTYTATGNSSRGIITVRAFRSSASEKIYLITVAMPNPTPDVKHITINFKP